MLIKLGSFFSNYQGNNIYSVARWQPKGYDYPELSFFFPRYFNGKAITIHDPKEFMREYIKVLIWNYSDIIRWLNYSYDNYDEITLLCWCNKERQKNKPLFCHTILIGYFIEGIMKNRNIKVIYLDGRDNPIWTREDFVNAVNDVVKQLF